MPFNISFDFTAMRNKVYLKPLKLTPEVASFDLPVILNILASVFFSIMKGTILNFIVKNCKVFKLSSSLSVAEILDF